MTTLFIRDNEGQYRAATPTEVIASAQRAIPRIWRRGSDVSSAADVRRMLNVRVAGLKHEIFYVLFLDSRFRLIVGEEMFRGTLNGAPVYPREIAARCLELGAAAVIVAHNHPSGDAEPSAADRGITARLKEALSLLEIRLLDHFVVGAGETTSFAERGWL